MYHYSPTAEKMKGQQGTPQRENYFIESILLTIIPIWRRYADKTGSTLFVEENFGRVELMLTNPKGVDVGEEDAGIKLALGLAACVGINISENEIQICVSYSIK